MNYSEKNKGRTEWDEKLGKNIKNHYRGEENRYDRRISVKNL